MVAVGRGDKPPPALGLQVVLAHQAADLLGIDDHPSNGPLPLWVADITYIAITTGFVYPAAFLTPGHAA